MNKRYIILIILTFLTATGISAQSSDVVQRHVRLNINKGNEAYRAGKYDEAETFYRSALQEDRNSSAALFNLALTLLKKNGNPISQNNDQHETSNKKETGSFSDPIELFNDVIALNRDQNQVVNSYYNLGNIHFEANKLQESIEFYKEVLRRDQNHIKARQNLRVAQMKLKEQQQQDQNKDQNQQNNQNQDKDQNKDNDQNKDQQDQKNNENDRKDEQNNQNDKNDSSEQNKNQDKPKENQGNQGNTGADQRSQMSKDNSDKILESAKKQEEQTRKKVEQRKGNQTTRRTTDRPW